MIKRREIREGNDIIARFMGYSPCFTIINKRRKKVWRHPDKSNHKLFDQFDYHTNWNSLMNVVEKIEKLGETSKRYGNVVTISTIYIGIDLPVYLDLKATPMPKINAVYRSVVKFIKTMEV